ncbi:MAG: helix-turn-helix transcriptional regulator [Alphaproteobacteria bacterium]
MMLNENPILSEREAVEFLGIASTRALQRWRQVGGGPPFVRLGRRIGYRRADLDGWVNKRRVGSTSEPMA